jgi:uncharacterized protein (TIGR03437 family)
MLKSLLFWAALPAVAQLIPAGMPVPKSALPPVVFLNGYQTYCGSAQFSDTFGKFDQFLQASARVTLFFDNCTIPGKPPIESLGQSFGAFLAALKYTDGTPVPEVDIVAHSMGGLIVRAYLSGMQTSGTFAPPANPGIRKAVFIGTPHFGTYAASIFGSDAQTQEMSLGSTFNFALATWNQGIDDLRGIDALSLSGNGGALTNNGQPDSDGVSSLTSASIGFAAPNRTRILPYCHISFAALQTIAGALAVLACPPGAPAIASAINATDSNVLAVQSFLNGTPDWQTIGQSPAQNPVASTQAGVLVRAKSSDDQFVSIVAAKQGTASLTVPAGNSTAYSEFVPAGTATTAVNAISASSNLPAGFTTALTLKPGPFIAAVISAAALVTPRAVAPGTFVSIYGTGFPAAVDAVKVLVNGAAIQVLYASATQINAVLPTSVSGLVTLTVSSSAGQHTVNVLTQPAVPAIFTADGVAASALNAVTGADVTSSSPLHGGDYVSLFLTGLGATTLSGGLQYANIPPVVTVAGQPCALQFAGLSPQFPGVDQINCQIPTGLGANAAAPVVVTSNGRASNTATLFLQ